MIINSEAGVRELSGESFVSDSSYHAINGGGDSNSGYDVILMKKGMLDIQQKAKDPLAQLNYENPDDIEKIYFYKSIIDTTEGVMAYAKRLSDYANQLAVAAFFSGSAMICFSRTLCICLIYVLVQRQQHVWSCPWYGTYSFWGSFCCWLVLGVILGKDGWALPPIAWISAATMVFGIPIISMSPFDIFRKKEDTLHEAA